MKGNKKWFRSECKALNSHFGKSWDVVISLSDSISGPVVYDPPEDPPHIVPLILLNSVTASLVFVILGHMRTSDGAEIVCDVFLRFPCSASKGEFQAVILRFFSAVFP